ncbi:MAG: SH3 domain-containing protein [Verrucomicrobia bacterium]|nr:SH3 domain-containing protein [Verrucomicrobiota bacterium]
MKLKHWMFAVLSFSLLAETILAQAPVTAPQDPQPPVIPAGDTPAPLATKPASKSATKKAAAKKAVAEKKAAPKSVEPVKSTSPLTPGPAVAREKNVNVRGQAAINSEIVTHLKRGDIVTVLDEITLKKSKTDEPGRWAKIALPAGSVVWVNSQFLNADKAVVPKRLNVRSGPGENYSILGRIDRGAVVKTVETKGDWTKIEAPTNSYAFVAAHLLSTDPADLGPALAKANPPAPAVVLPPPTEVAVVTSPAVAIPPAETITPPPTAPVTPPPVVIPPPPLPTETEAVPAPVTPPPPVVDEPPLKRIVTREGIIKGSASIQAPTYFVLRSLDNNKTINYLFSPNTNITVKSMQLQRVIVTGEEILDERWPNTPVINIDSIEVVPQQ